MRKYNGQFKNIVAKKDFSIGDSSNFDFDITINKGDECSCVEYDKSHYLSAVNEYAPYKVVFKSVKDFEGNNATQWLAKDEIEDMFNLVK
jgi:hypothetical protein